MNVRKSPFDDGPPIWVTLIFQDGPAKGCIARLPVEVRVGEYYIFTRQGMGRMMYTAAAKAVPIAGKPLLFNQEFRLANNTTTHKHEKSNDQTAPH